MDAPGQSAARRLVARVLERMRPASHRAVAGGHGEEIGKLQFEFLVAQGLAASQRLLDIGCGSLCGGMHFIRYLDTGNYTGIDIDADLLRAGREIELVRAGLQSKQPQLMEMDDFGFGRLGRTFEFALAQSVLTHLSINSIQRCLVNVAQVLEPGGQFFATFFEDVRGRNHVAPLTHRNRAGETLATYPDRDPYHYSLEVFQWLCEGIGLEPGYIGEWGHPWGQKMIVFRKTGDGPAERIVAPPPKTRRAPWRKAQPGDSDYRAYVGPPERYDLVSAMVFNLLTTLGLRARDRLLDIGCGSLRCGRLLIPYLEAGHYAGVEPNTWLIDEAIANEIGGDLIRIKQPRFYSRDDFVYDESFGQFDFIVAQSILSHTSYAQMERCIASVAERLTSSGVFAGTFMMGQTDYERAEWLYPGCAGYRETTVAALAEKHGLRYMRLAWRHPHAQTWFVMAKGGFDLSRAEPEALQWNRVVEREPK